MSHRPKKLCGQCITGRASQKMNLLTQNATSLTGHIGTIITQSDSTHWKNDKRCKNTNCPFELKIKIQNLEYSKKRPENSVFDENFPCEIHFTYVHNHNTKVLQALTYRDMKITTKQQAFDLFLNRKTPSSAKAEQQKKLKENIETAEEYELKHADRSEQPRLNDMKNLFKEFNREKFGSRNGPELINHLREVAVEYNEKCSNEGGHIEVKCLEPNNDDKECQEWTLIVCIITPLMRRVHKHIIHSGELAFMDSTGNLDKMNCRIFMLCTHSPAGALPLAIFITSDEKETTMKSALDLVKECAQRNWAISYYHRQLLW